LVDFIYVGFSTEIEVIYNTKALPPWYMAYTPFPLLHLEHILLTGLLLKETLIFHRCFN